MANVFLSYGRGDAARARPIAAALEQAGHSVWWDQHIGGGSQFSKAIEQALDSADIVVVLWSVASVDSAWVRDEASAGRDRGRLVPLSVEGTLPPIGFRQFQAIDLGRWSGRGKVPRLAEILAAIATLADEAPTSASSARFHAPPLASPIRVGRRAVAAIGVALLAVAALGTWWWTREPRLPVVRVVAADSSPGAQAASNDLFAKLGSLPQLGDSKWRLVDASSSGGAGLIFRTTDDGSQDQPEANLVLLDGSDNSVLWSRSFTFPSGGQADLRQQLSLTAGRVLGCALESRDQSGLTTDLRKLFLNTCAPPKGGEDNGEVTQLRRIVDQVPRFRPAWSRLLLADVAEVDATRFTADGARPATQLTADAARARKIFPNLSELTIANLRLEERTDYGHDLALLESALRRDPDNPQLLAEWNNALGNVGRMSEAIAVARRAAELDPLGPSATVDYIMALAYGDQIDDARNELAKAEKLWAGTAALKNAQIGFHMRFHDPAVAFKLDSVGYNTAFYYHARMSPTSANIAKLKAGIDEFRPKQINRAQVGWAIQGLAEFGLVDDVFYWLGRLPEEQVASISSLFFRPAMASVRRDPRFMPLAAQIGLVRYWKSSGKWPDFCQRPGITYDCKAEAAKLN